MSTPRQEGEWLLQLRHVPGIGSAAPFSEDGVATIEHVEERYLDLDVFGGASDTAQAIDQQISAKAFALMAQIDADHGDISCRYLAMPGPIAAKLFGQLAIMDGMGIGCVETDQFPIRTGKDKNSDIASLGELVRRLPEIVIDLLYPAGKSRPIMP